MTQHDNIADSERWNKLHIMQVIMLLSDEDNLFIKMYTDFLFRTWNA